MGYLFMFQGCYYEYATYDDAHILTNISDKSLCGHPSKCCRSPRDSQDNGRGSVQFGLWLRKFVHLKNIQMKCRYKELASLVY